MSGRTNKFILDLSYVFALKIVAYAEVLEKLRNYDEAGRLFKSGTSIGANIRDAQSSESNDGFLYNLTYAVKEAEETEKRLRQYRNSEDYPDVNDLLKDIAIMKQLLKDMISSVSSLKFQVSNSQFKR